MEIEAKYKASDEGFSGLLQACSLGDYSLGNIKEQILNDLYMDTFDRDMLKARYALRIRKGNDKWLATIKGLGGSKGAIHQREEYETEIQPNTNPQEWPSSDARDIVISVTRSKPLCELFYINQLRRTRPVRQKERFIGRMSLDIVEMESEGRVERTYEVEIELDQDGTLEDLRELDSLIRLYSLCPEPISKFKRAMDLIGINRR